MRITEIARSALLSVLSNKFRVALTSLGIIIGSFTIIMVVGIGKASEDEIAEQYKRLSVETITIAKTQSRVSLNSGGGISFGKSLTKDLAMAMPETLEHVKSVGVSSSTSGTIAYGANSKTLQIQGINESYAEITHLFTEYGDMFTDEDGVLRNKVAVIGYNVALALFGEDYADYVGEKVFVKGMSFTLTGVLRRIGGTGGGMEGAASPDDTVYIPYDVAIKYTSGAAGTRGAGMAIALGSASATTFVALADNISFVPAAIEEISAYIFDIVGDYTSYTVTDAGSTLSSALATSGTMSSLLMAVAAIVLIVSGIGIMNVLLVSVNERTREIGILKSLGASRAVILGEFLTEAVFISVIGGSLGVALSYFAPTFLKYLNADYSSSLRGLLIGFIFSVATGIFFGFYPAYKASNLKPIEALNAE